MARTNLRRTPIESFDRYLADAARACARKPLFMGLTGAVGAILCSLLYLLDYHQGEYPLIGFCLAMAIGSALPLAFVFGELRSELVRATFTRVIGFILGCSIVVGFIFSPALYLVLTTSVDSVNWMHPAIIEFVHNETANPMKPISHVAMGSIVLFAIAPVLMAVWPLYLRSGLDVKSTFQFVWRRVEDIHYDWRVVSLMLAALALVAVWIPVINSLIPGFMAILSVGLFRKLLSSYA